VFAPWVEGAGVGERGVEFEIWRGGVRAVRGEGVGTGGGGVGENGGDGWKGGGHGG